MRAWRVHKAGDGEESARNSLYVGRQLFRGEPTDSHGGAANTWSRLETGIVIKPNTWFRTTIHVIQDHDFGLFELYYNGKLVLRKVDVETFRNPDANRFVSMHQCYTRNVPEGVVLWNYTDDWTISDKFIPLEEIAPPTGENRFLLLFLIMLLVFAIIVMNSLPKSRS